MYIYIKLLYVQKGRRNYKVAKLSNEVTKLRTELEIETNERKRLESLLSNPLHTKRSLL